MYWLTNSWGGVDPRTPPRDICSHQSNLSLGIIKPVIIIIIIITTYTINIRQLDFIKKPNPPSTLLTINFLRDVNRFKCHLEQNNLFVKVLNTKMSSFKFFKLNSSEQRFRKLFRRIVLNKRNRKNNGTPNRNYS